MSLASVYKNGELLSPDHLMCWLDADQAASHVECLTDDNLKDEHCTKCARLLPANQHLIRCYYKPCPMSNGVSLLDMLFGSDEQAEE